MRSIVQAVAGWIGRLGDVWVEGQVTQLTRRPGSPTCFLVLRDPVANVSVSVTVRKLVLDEAGAVSEGTRVVVGGRFEIWPERGSLSLSAREIRPVGVGALLARIEQLRATLAAEGLFAPERKRPLPFLPREVGLITGRAGAARHDVETNAALRWPAVTFVTKEVAVQGSAAVFEVMDALAALDRRPEVDVIVIARGGGGVEDLLPFSDEALCRAVFACRTPVVSAIGHEQDRPLIDLVADARASTPTDAARRVVPDVREELARIAADRDRLDRALDGLLRREQQRLDSTRNRPALADPSRRLDDASVQVRALRERAQRSVTHHLAAAGHATAALAARVRALSPQATLDRGYAVLTAADGSVVRGPVVSGAPLRARVAEGRFTVTAD